MAKKKKEAKTNAARILDTLGISYELKTYEVDESDLSAVHVAESVGMPIEMVYKTLVCRGDKNGIDQMAVDAMRKMFDTVHINGTVVIGEGEMDEAPMLYIGEEVGAGGPDVDIAVDPVEGTNLVAKGQNGAIAVIAMDAACFCLAQNAPTSSRAPMDRSASPRYTS